MYQLFNLLLPDPAPHARSSNEQISAALIGALHLFLAIMAVALLVVPNHLTFESISFFIAGEIFLGLLSWTGLGFALYGSARIFGVLIRLEGLLTTLMIAGLPWLNISLINNSVLCALYLSLHVGYTAVQGSNSVQLSRRRPYFTWLIVPTMGLSYLGAFAVGGHWIYAIAIVGWCFIIVSMTHLGFKSLKTETEGRRESEFMVRTDTLTGSLSRLAILADLDNIATREGQWAFVLIDLDGFKAINDSYGHLSGDVVLQVVAYRLRETFPKGTSIGRLGGDEFAAIVPVGLQDHQTFERTISKALIGLNVPIQVHGREVFVSASAGWTFAEPDSTSASLITEADAAMYESKLSQTQSVTAFNPQIRAELDRDLELRQELKVALKKNQITHFAQPIVRLDNYEPVAVELLARWKLDGQFIPPADFIRVAEETGQAVELDVLSLDAAQKLVSTWTNPRFNDIIAKVNISPFHLSNKALLKTIEECVEPELRNRVGVELVESRLISSDLQVRELMSEIRDQGMDVSIDDFGVGYSSLSYLRELPISEVKLDMSFVRNLHQDKINQGLVRAIVEIASTLGLPTVAEGIESVEVFEAARDLGVTYGQGYFIGRPMPFSAINIWLGENIKANAPALL